VRARPGNVLRFAGRRHGARAYVAVAGGIDVPVVLGSRSTDLAGGFGGHGGRALRVGDVLGAGRPFEAGREERTQPVVATASATVRIVPGPQDDLFAEGALDALLAGDYAVGALSDRAACRLSGAPLLHAGPGEIVTDGMVPGCVQVPPDGQPIVMLADCPSTGGYPKIATVVSGDLPLLGQLLPGEGRVRFKLA
jgi:antagonist of KipI